MSQTTYTIELDGNEIDLTIEYDAIYQPAKVSGPPEDCYPDESSCDITDVTFDLSPDATCTEEQVIAYLYTAKVREQLHDACWEDYMTRGVDDDYRPF